MLQVFLADRGHQVLQGLLVKMASQDSLDPVACLALKVPLVRSVVKVLKVRNSVTSFQLLIDFFFFLFLSFLWITGCGCTLYTCKVQKYPELGT